MSVLRSFGSTFGSFVMTVPTVMNLHQSVYNIYHKKIYKYTTGNIFPFIQCVSFLGILKRTLDVQYNIVLYLRTTIRAIDS